MPSFRPCRGCDQPVPASRRADAQYCTDACRDRRKRAHLRLGDQEYPPGSYMVFLHDAQSGWVLCAYTQALRMRVRAARAQYRKPLTVVGVIKADRDRVRRFRRAFRATRARGAWYWPTDALAGYIRRRTEPIPAAPIRIVPVSELLSDANLGIVRR